MAFGRREIGSVLGLRPDNLPADSLTFCYRFIVRMFTQALHVLVRESLWTTIID